MNGQLAQRAPEPSLPIIRCAKCRRRLFDGFLFGIIKCPHCNWLTKFIDKGSEASYDAAKVK